MKPTRSLCPLLVLCILLSSVVQTVQATEQAMPVSSSVVFALDASNSMNSNDRDRLAKDSIAQLIYSLPSDYSVGFVAYNNDVASEVALQDASHRTNIMAAVEDVQYIGYTNAGAGLSKALELLESSDAPQKTVVILSDGEIVMQNDTTTTKSAAQFRAAVEAARIQGIRIHVIGLGADMADNDNTIFYAPKQTEGENYYAPKATDIQSAVDTILTEQLHVKKSRAAIIDTTGGLEDITVSIPTANTTRTRILLTSPKPIQNLKADFNAKDGWQHSGLHYTLLELEHPTSQDVHITFQSQPNSQVKVDMITEYCLIPHVDIIYSDSKPNDADTDYYTRSADISISFYDIDAPNRQVLTDSDFQNVSVHLTQTDQFFSAALQEGIVSFQREVLQDDTLELELDLARLNTNIVMGQSVELILEGPPSLPQSPLADMRPQIIIIALFLLALFLVLLVHLASHRKRPAPVQSEQVLLPQQEPSRYSYSGRLNIYITRTRSGYDIPPLTYDLFRLPGSKKLSLQEVLDSCGITEPMDGADRILFASGAGRCLLLSNNSDCTLIQNREILMKGHSYQISLNSKVDVAFEDECSELVLQYRDVKPSEMRHLAAESQ